MVADPNKFNSIILTRDKAENLDLEIKIGDHTIKSEQYVKCLGVTIGNKSNFETHVIASAQLNAPFRLNYILSFNAKSVLVQNFIYANFNYCPLVWHFSSSKSLLNVEKNQKRALRFLHNDTETSYQNLVHKTNKNFMSIYGLRSLCVKAFKIVNDLNPSFIKDIFQLRIKGHVRTQNANNFTVETRKIFTFGTNNI